MRQSAITDKCIKFLDGVNTSYEAFLHGVKLSGNILPTSCVDLI